MALRDKDINALGPYLGRDSVFGPKEDGTGAKDGGKVESRVPAAVKSIFARRNDKERSLAHTQPTQTYSDTPRPSNSSSCTLEFLGGKKTTATSSFDIFRDGPARKLAWATVAAKTKAFQEDSLALSDSNFPALPKAKESRPVVVKKVPAQKKGATNIVSPDDETQRLVMGRSLQLLDSPSPSQTTKQLEDYVQLIALSDLDSTTVNEPATKSSVGILGIARTIDPSNQILAPGVQDALLKNLGSASAERVPGIHRSALGGVIATSSSANDAKKSPVEPSEYLRRATKDLMADSQTTDKEKTLVPNDKDVTKPATLAIIKEHVQNIEDGGLDLPPPRRLAFEEETIFGSNEVRHDPHSSSLDITSYLASLQGDLRTRTDYAVLIANLVDKQGQVKGVEMAEAVLRHLLVLNSKGDLHIRPDGGMYNKVMHGLALKGEAQKVEAVLNLMIDDYLRNGNQTAAPNTRHFTTLLNAWQKANLPEGPEHCEGILANMHKLYEDGFLPECRPDHFAYTSVLHCWSDSKRGDASLRAEALFRKMKARFEDGDEYLRPDHVAYSNLINAFAKGDGFVHAEKLLWEMVDDYLNGNDACKPRIRNLNTIIACWSRVSARHSPENAERIVGRWIRVTEETKLDTYPDSYTFSLLLKCWSVSNRRDASEKLAEALSWMEDLAKSGMTGAAIENVKMSTCMRKWLSSGNFKVAAKTLQWTSRSFLTGTSDYVPEPLFYHKTIHGLCDHKDVSTADVIIRILWDVDQKTGCHLRCGLSRSLASRIICGWNDLGQPDRSETLLLRMDQLSQSSSKSYLYVPDRGLYLDVIEGWKESKFHDRRHRVKLLRSKMDQVFGRFGKTRTKQT